MNSLTESIELVYETTYWACNIFRHHHRSKEKADACIALKSGNRKAYRKEDYYSRNIRIARDVIGGEAYATVAQRNGLSVGRSGQIVSSVLRRASFIEYARNNESPKDTYWGDPISKHRENSEYWLGVLGRYEKHLEES
jgi:hypothetical protein|tara:strand:+ start:366 stop:782 length:417 start_codon:yes stop_codon:yes gene_type:complete